MRLREQTKISPRSARRVSSDALPMDIRIGSGIALASSVMGSTRMVLRISSASCTSERKEFRL
jgi:hypothetical protein